MKKFNNFKEYIEDWARTPVPEDLGEYHVFSSLEDFIKMQDKIRKEKESQNKSEK